MVERKKVRKVLGKKLKQLNDIAADIEELLVGLEIDFYRVCIFGSARIGPESPFYKQVEDLAEALAKEGVDVVTGGGPGLMEAANKGAKKGGSPHSRSIGLTVHLPFEADSNSHLDVKLQHKRFSSRLDEFMRISHAVIVTPGGIGTLLELFYTWQLMQVNHIRPRPFILMGHDEMWTTFLDWMRQWPLRLNLMSDTDFDMIQVRQNVPEVMSFLGPDIEKFRKNLRGMSPPQKDSPGPDGGA